MLQGSFAFYESLSWNFFSRFSLDGTVRYTSESKEFALRQHCGERCPMAASVTELRVGYLIPCYFADNSRVAT